MIDRVSEALEFIAQFEDRGIALPSSASKLVSGILRACGHDVIETGFIEDQEGVDCYFRTEHEGRKQLIGVEVRSNTAPVPAGVVETALELKSNGNFDRVMVIASGRFTLGALYHAEAVALGEVDLLVPDDLRNWIIKHTAQEDDPALTITECIIRTAMENLALEIAENPTALWDQEWRDLERILHVAFKGIGFHSVLTRSARDGGFDLELKFNSGKSEEVYLVEVKHWMESKPGKSQLKKLIRVTAEREATGGLLLSTSGFTNTICSGIAECEKPIHLGGADKIIGICRTYYRIKTALWTRLPNPAESLFGGTVALSDDKHQ